MHGKNVRRRLIALSTNPQSKYNTPLKAGYSGAQIAERTKEMIHLSPLPPTMTFKLLPQRCQLEKGNFKNKKKSSSKQIKGKEEDEKRERRPRKR